MMEDYWFLPDVGGQPLQKFFECHMEEAKRCAQQPSKRPQKTDTTPQIFQKKLQRIVYFYLCYGQASCWEVYNASFHIFLVGLRYCKLTLLHYCVQETSGGTGMLHATEITPHIVKPSSKKQMAFKYVAYKFLQKKFRAVL